MSNKIKTPFGSVEIVTETPEFQVAIINVEPGKSPCLPHVHKKTFEFEYLLEGELVCNGKPICVGTSRAWKIEEPHGYENKSGKLARLVCFSCPPWTKEDEIRVEEKK